ncbi:MAG: redoxin family protein, partial [Bacteroidales bacterium]|nr:redoxin family protein [Bacteroidales bacterium]
MKNTYAYARHIALSAMERLTNMMLLLIVVFVLVSCKQAVTKSGGSSVKDDTLKTVFTPNPQRVPHQEIYTMKIGSKAVDFNLPDVTGRYYQLEDFEASDVLVVIFTCNHCPTAQAYENRIISFTEDYKDKSVAVAAIMPNSMHSLLYEECSYSDLDDSYESMIIRAKDKKFNFPYLYDGDSEAVSIQYGPTATPHAFVFNRKRELVYTGRLDASEKPGTANADDLRAAVNETLNGQTVTTPENKAFGCSIKWAWKTEWTEKANKNWAEKPVIVEKISRKGVADLVRNDTEKLRLINIWATWCGPCVIEYPELISLQRMYGNRNFEFISLSADKPENADQVLEFLQAKHSPIKNYLFNS